jgi:hypothetical protein
MFETIWSATFYRHIHKQLVSTGHMKAGNEQCRSRSSHKTFAHVPLPACLSKRSRRTVAQQLPPPVWGTRQGMPKIWRPELASTAKAKAKRDVFSTNLPKVRTASEDRRTLNTTQGVEFNQIWTNYKEIYAPALVQKRIVKEPKLSTHHPVFHQVTPLFFIRSYPRPNCSLCPLRYTINFTMPLVNWSVCKPPTHHRPVNFNLKLDHCIIRSWNKSCQC